MSQPCDRIQAEAAGLAALPRGDAERDAAWQHADGCADCRRALDDGERVLKMIDALPPPPPPSAEALLRASRDIVRELEHAGRGRTVMALVSGIFLAWGVELLLARHRAGESMAWIQSAIAAVLAAVGAAGALRAGGQVVAATAVLSGLFAALVGSGGGLEPEIGVHCVLAELFAAAITLAPITVMVLRKAASARGGPFFAAIASAGALAGHAALNLTCPVRTFTPHLFAFHTGGVLLAAALGYAASRLRPLSA